MCEYILSPIKPLDRMDPVNKNLTGPSRREDDWRRHGLSAVIWHLNKDKQGAPGLLIENS